MFPILIGLAALAAAQATPPAEVIALLETGARERQIEVAEELARTPSLLMDITPAIPALLEAYDGLDCELSRAAESALIEASRETATAICAEDITMWRSILLGKLDLEAIPVIIDQARSTKDEDAWTLLIFPLLEMGHPETASSLIDERMAKAAHDKNASANMEALMLIMSVAMTGERAKCEHRSLSRTYRASSERAFKRGIVDFDAPEANELLREQEDSKKAWDAAESLVLSTDATKRGTAAVLFGRLGEDMAWRSRARTQLYRLATDEHPVVRIMAACYLVRLGDAGISSDVLLGVAKLDIGEIPFHHVLAGLAVSGVPIADERLLKAARALTRQPGSMRLFACRMLMNAGDYETVDTCAADLLESRTVGDPMQGVLLYDRLGRHASLSALTVRRLLTFAASEDFRQTLGTAALLHMDSIMTTGIIETELRGDLRFRYQGYAHAPLLGEEDRPKVVAKLMECAIRAQTRHERMRALDAVASCQDAVSLVLLQLLSQLEQAIAAGDDYAQLPLCRALGFSRSTKPVKLLVSVVAKDNRASIIACQALGMLGEHAKEAVPALLAEVTDDRRCPHILQAVSRIGVPLTESETEVVLGTLEYGGHSAAAALLALPRVARSHGVAALNERLSHSSPQIRLYAVQGLCLIDSVSARQAILGALSTCDDNSLKQRLQVLLGAAMHQPSDQPD